MNKTNNLNANLKSIKDFQQLSLAEFAKELNIPRAILQSVMNEGQPTLDTVCRIAEGVDCMKFQGAFTIFCGLRLDNSARLC